MLIKEILATKGAGIVLYTIAPDKTLGEAVEIMNDLDVGSLVVFDHGRMSGMLTFREVLRALGKAGSAWGAVAVSQAMMSDPLRTAPDTPIEELRREMIEKHQRYIPVMEGETLLGVVSFHDVAKAILEEQRFENKMLKSYIRDWPTDAGPVI